MQKLINNKVKIGQKICKHNGENLGYGLFVEKENIVASIYGEIKRTQTSQYYVDNKFSRKAIGVAIGAIVYAKVLKCKQEEVFVQIIQINNFSVNRPFEAVIRKQHIRQKLIDQIKTIECFKINDIIRAKIISLGDSSRNLYLSTAGEDLGVLIAISEENGKIMMPYDWSTMVDMETGNKESRKVAKPQIKIN